MSFRYSDCDKYFKRLFAMSSASEELQVLAAVYCKQGELVLDDTSIGACFTLTLHPADLDESVKFTCSLADNYPARVPRIQVSRPAFTRSDTFRLQDDLETYVRDNGCLGEPMLSLVVDWLQDYLVDFCKQRNKNALLTVKPVESKVTCVLSLDHMRSKSKYTKTLQTWANELDIQGMILFFKNYILIVLYGCDAAVKQFICCQKTRNIDVDAAGKPCKERMLKVLIRDETVVFSRDGFDVVNCQTRVDVERAFSSCGLDCIFHQNLGYMR